MNAKLSGAHLLLHPETSQVDTSMGSTHLPSATWTQAPGVGWLAGALLDLWEPVRHQSKGYIELGGHQSKALAVVGSAPLPLLPLTGCCDLAEVI